MRRLAAVVAMLVGLGVAAQACAACKLEEIIELPVTMEGLRPVFEARINGRNARFVADSGAFFSLLSRAGAATLDLNFVPAPLGFYITGAGGAVTPELATARTLEIGGSQVHDVQFLVGGSDVVGAHAVGVMGENLLGLADAEYDFAAGAIRLFRPKGCGGEALAYWAPGKPITELDIEPRDAREQPFIAGPVLVNGVSIRAIFDTGSPVTILSLRAARRAGIQIDGPGVHVAGFGGGIGSRMTRNWVAEVASVDIAGEQIKRTELTIGDVGGETDMLVGMDFFLSHHVYVANSQHRLYFTYNGAPVFKLSSSPAQVADAQTPAAADKPRDGNPPDADGFSRRGAAFASRRDFLHAEADFTRAIALAPKDAGYLAQRARVRMAEKQAAGALADLDAALALEPDDYGIRLLRAEARFSLKDQDGALSDLNAASAAAPKVSDLRFDMGNLYKEMGRYDRAIEQYDLWMRDHEDDGRRTEVFDARCSARSLGDRELDRALSDCNVAARLSHGAAQMLDTRGLVHFRRGETEQAIADYDAALKLNPQIASSLYGRGMAEEKMGEGAKGRQDIAAAVAIDPELPETAAKAGLMPPAAPPSSAASR